ncbi:MAG TPA: gluconate 2-dehydrogenase subunit 3 family protein [Ktedonobacteraceae bacterium]|nr:gluconate 2-dehydrogenase subunit 3 family protein [Ktedonobacteraceae bacterium]
MKLRHKTNSTSPTDAAMQQVDKNRLPVDAKTGQPLPPRAQPGYYPGFSTLSQQAFWDEATRRVVRARVEQVPPIRFFTPEEARLMEAVCDRLLPQDDRDEAHKIPLVNTIDERLASGKIDGYRFEGMPPDHEAHRLGLQAIEAIAQYLFQQSFVQVGPCEQDQVLQTIHDCRPPAGEAIWQKMSVQRFWMLLMQDAIEAYYAHPYAWDEVGFGGPAYPRGYMRLEGGKPEPWEVEEQRYAWQAPPSALSDVYTPIGGPGGQQQPPSGQEGTH